MACTCSCSPEESHRATAHSRTCPARDGRRGVRGTSAARHTGQAGDGGQGAWRTSAAGGGRRGARVTSAAEGGGARGSCYACSHLCWLVHTRGQHTGWTCPISTRGERVDSSCVYSACRAASEPWLVAAATCHMGGPQTISRAIAAHTSAALRPTLSPLPLNTRAAK